MGENKDFGENLVTIGFAFVMLASVFIGATI